MAKASAGRVLMLNKGTYNAETTYVALDYVSHNQKMWLCKKTALGIEPTEGSEYWDLMFNIEIIDNLTTDDANYALSARQGKVIGEKLGNEDISELGDSVTEALNYLKENSGSTADKVKCDDGETAQDKFDKAIYIGEKKSIVDPLPRNADILGGKYTADDIDEINGNLAEKLNKSKIAIVSGTCATNATDYAEIVLPSDIKWNEVFVIGAIIRNKTISARINTMINSDLEILIQSTGKLYIRNTNSGNFGMGISVLLYKMGD